MKKNQTTLEPPRIGINSFEHTRPLAWMKGPSSNARYLGKSFFNDDDESFIYLKIE